jgi:hypothetical protein
VVRMKGYFKIGLLMLRNLKGGGKKCFFLGWGCARMFINNEIKKFLI